MKSIAYKKRTLDHVSEGGQQVVAMSMHAPPFSSRSTQRARIVLMFLVSVLISE